MRAKQVIERRREVQNEKKEKEAAERKDGYRTYSTDRFRLNNEHTLCKLARLLRYGTIFGRHVGATKQPITRHTQDNK